MQEPIGELDGAVEQFFAEVAEGDIPAGHNEHDAERRKIDEINDHHRKEGAVLDQVGLSLPQHPDRERHMKAPGEPDDPENPSSIRFHINEHADPAVQEQGENAIDREKVRRQ